jgi:hypothetical protein
MEKPKALAGLESTLDVTSEYRTMTTILERYDFQSGFDNNN